MICLLFLRLITLLSLLSPLVTTLSQYQQPLIVPRDKILSLPLSLNSPTRITLLLHAGLPQGTLSTPFLKQSINSSFQQFIFDHPTNLALQLRGVVVGVLKISPLEEWQSLSLGEELFLSVVSNGFRGVEVRPKNRVVLNVHRLSGRVGLAYLRCEEKERKDCLNRLSRISHVSLSFPGEKIYLEACSSCAVILHFEGEGALRITTGSSFSVLAGEPGVEVLERGQKSTWIIHGLVGQKGALAVLSGQVRITHSSGAIELTAIKNGWNYQILSTETYPIELRVTAIINSSFVVHSPSFEGILQLKDGVPSSLLLSQDHQTAVRMPLGCASLHLSGSAHTLSSLSIKFIGPSRTHTYKPKFFFSQTEGSVSFRLDNSSGDYKVVVEGRDSGLVSFLSSGKEPVLLGSEGRYSSVLVRNRSDFFFLPFLEGSELVVKKCVQCQLLVGLGSSQFELREEEMQQRHFVIPLAHFQVLQLTTNNYAFYSLEVRKSSSQLNRPCLKDSSLQIFLTEPETEVELQFEVPSCLQGHCQGVNYSIIEGSDSKAVASRAYCPNTLFDLEEHTKDVFIYSIEPTFHDNMATVRFQGKRDWVVVVMQVEDVVLSTELGDVGEVRRYSQLRWPAFFLFTFLTLAGVVTVAVVMGSGVTGRSDYVYLRSHSQE